MNISSPRDIEATERYLQFCLGWFANPIYAGDYPRVMKDHIGEPSHVRKHQIPHNSPELKRNVHKARGWGTPDPKELRTGY